MLWWSALAIILAAAACAILFVVFLVGCGGLHYHVLACCLAVSPSNNYVQAYLWAEFGVVSVCASIVWPGGGLQ